MALKWALLQNSSSTVTTKEEKRDAGEPGRRTGITFRLAKVFSKQESKKCVEQTAPFLGLPYELLEQIFDAIESKNDLCRLRSTCTSLNEYLQPRVFEELIIDSATRGSHRTGHLLRALASGKVPYCHLAKTLRISSLLIFSAPSQSHWQNPNIDHTLQPLKEHYILPAMMGLRSLKRLYWDAKINDPCALMAEGLAAIPSLEELHVTMDRWSRTCAFPFDKFGRLSVLSVSGAEGESSVAKMKKAILASPHLQDLRIGIPTHDPSAFDDILPISVRHLSLLDAYCPSFSQSSLSALTSLAVPNVSELQTAPLWHTLAECNVRLTSIAVESVNANLLTYLGTYSGLQSMQLTFGAYTAPTCREMLSRFFSEVLPRHRETLSTLLLDSHRERDCRALSKHPFALKKEQLEYILQCIKLETLSVVVHQYAWTYEADISPHNSRGIVNVAGVLNDLASLPRLRHLSVTPSWSYDANRRGSMHVQRRQAKEAMLKEVQSVEVPALDTFKFAVQVLDTPLTVTRKDVGGRRRYAFSIPSASASLCKNDSDPSVHLT
ncbi:hypothetical protein NMY22_g13596 [Coprinellus aureogranulatus]|nr:hypothetical protein NMY22_g13596 [Coprinellus aureogranulatus]